MKSILIKDEIQERLDHERRQRKKLEEKISN